MKHLKNLALAAILALASVSAFAQAPAATTTASAATSATSVVQIATDVRDEARKHEDKYDEAKAVLAQEKLAIAAAENGIKDLDIDVRPAARKALNDRRKALAIAEKRLAQTCSKCSTSSFSAAQASVTKKVVTHEHVQSATHENAALKAQLLALQLQLANGGGVTASAQASAGAGTASAHAAAAVTTQMVAVQTGSSAGYPANGQEVCDAIGNCSRSTQGGSMVCQNAINGKILEYDFAPLGITQEQARSYCRASGDRFLARHRSTTPDQSGMTSVSAVPSAPPVAVQPAPSKSAGKITCEFKVDGVVRESYPVTSEQECSTSNQSKAQALGLVAVR